MSMVRAVYSLLMWLAQPLLKRKLARRGKVEAGYRDAIGERFGRYTQPASSGWFWVHAVSLGETRAAAILLAALREADPHLRLLLTHGTATGRAEGAKLLRPGDVQVWQPWDTPGAVQRFLAHFRPSIGVLIETEVWPNLVAACHRRELPLVLVNARMSEKTLAEAERLAWLARPTYAALAAVHAQTEADAERLARLGAPVASVTGNLKFDARPDTAQAARGRRWRANAARPVVLFASSREGEEAALFDVLKQNRPPVRVESGVGAPDSGAVQWLVVPRHPQRFDAVAALAAERGLTVVRRSGWGESGPAEVAEVAEGADVWLGDSLGEMALYYGLADVALLGGSFERLGGQNLIEALACGCPVVMGPHTFNFADAAAQAEAAGAAQRVEGIAEAVAAALRIAGDAGERQRLSALGEAFVDQHRGAARRTAEALLARQGARPGEPERV